MFYRHQHNREAQHILLFFILLIDALRKDNTYEQKTKSDLIYNFFLLQIILAQENNEIMLAENNFKLFFILLANNFLFTFSFFFFKLFECLDKKEIY